MDGAMMTAHMEDYDLALVALDGAKDAWAQTSVAYRIAILQRVKDNLMGVAADWA
jgi:acyl-CoA reductase-like NAD-dependent aldehyde dehydrogenase